MPIFEYRCERCGHCFEAIVLNGRQPEACPACAQPALEKLLSTFATHAGGGPMAASPAACGSCGDPRGPGSCRMH